MIFDGSTEITNFPYMVVERLTIYKSVSLAKTTDNKSMTRITLTDLIMTDLPSIWTQLKPHKFS